jgi:flagellar protein FliO/FliZ
MSIPDLIRMLAAFAITMGLFFGAVWGFKRFAPDVMKRLQGDAAIRKRRLAIVETLVLSPQQRLVLVSFDGTERLVLLGGGQVLDPPKTASRKIAP